MKKLTIEDVAKAAGVSTTTVSRVINKVPSVAPANRIKVEEAIKKLKYKPNASAQRLAGGKTNTIGLVIPRYPGVFYSFYAIEIIRSIGTYCERMKIDLLLHLGSKNSIFNYSAVDGIIFADLLENESQYEEAKRLSVPSIVINRKLDDPDANFIAVDNLNAAYEAVKYLISLGHKFIAHVTGDLKTQAARERLEGYKKALKAFNAGLDDKYIFEGDYSRMSSRKASEKLLKMSKRPTAVFFASDDMAMEAISVFSEKGINVGRDISVIGFDDDPVGLQGPVKLTTVKQPLNEMCEKALESLLYMISGKPPVFKNSVLKCELVARDSVSPRA